jgi:uncharacterized protein YndB with AHSA1/START domain
MNSAIGPGRSNDNTTLELPSDTDILITHSFAAPIEVVYEALTQPQYVRRWWAPKTRGEMLSCEMDVRVGGKWRYVMRANAGFEVGFSGEYREIVAPHRIVCSEISVVTLTLEQQGPVTLLRSLSHYPSKAVRDQVIASGMESGMRESYVQLDEVVASLAKR